MAELLLLMAAYLEYLLNIMILAWLVVATHLKNISQNGNLPQVGVKVENIPNHHLVASWYSTFAGGPKFDDQTIISYEGDTPTFAWSWGKTPRDKETCHPLLRSNELIEAPQITSFLQVENPGENCEYMEQQWDHVSPGDFIGNVTFIDLF